MKLCSFHFGPQAPGRFKAAGAHCAVRNADQGDAVNAAARCPSVALGGAGVTCRQPGLSLSWGLRSESTHGLLLRARQQRDPRALNKLLLFRLAEWPDTLGKGHSQSSNYSYLISRRSFPVTPASLHQGDVRAGTSFSRRLAGTRGAGGLPWGSHATGHLSAHVAVHAACATGFAAAVQCDRPSRCDTCLYHNSIPPAEEGDR